MRRKECHQEIRQRLLPALELFESSLDRPVRLEVAAWTCCLSPYHFHRLFSRIIGAPPATYVRERRLSRAAQELLMGERNVEDLAFRSGWGSGEAFSRAFRGQFHLSPLEYRNQGFPLFLRESELSCPPELARPSSHQASGPSRVRTRRLAGLFLRGANDHPSNMRLLYAFLGQHPDRHDPHWTIADRYMPVAGGLDYEFFVGREVEDLSRVPDGLDALEIPARDELEVGFHGSVDELHVTLPGSVERELGAQGLEQEPGSWKIEQSQGPRGWVRGGFCQRVQVRES